VLSAGDEPSEVAESVIEEIRSREKNGIVELPPRTFTPGEAVTIVGGPLRGISAVFDRYMSGSQRVALLIDLIAGANVRTIMPATLIAPAETSSWTTTAPRRASAWK
jgi:transcription antitermination factor NusG